ncbi:MAG: 1-acyl-sn-glycerol-3-phosphate acyltransferase [Ferruginibacter sp.]
MLYNLIKIPARLALLLYCRQIRFRNKAALQSTGPLLIASNHPNSFLDAVILATLFRQPVYSLARGDAFKNKTAARLLKALHILPVYRATEGVENLEHNYKTFDACKEIFRKNGIVLIFSEGRCINEWHLRPLRKGTARLAISAWQDGIPLKVLPTGINYSSFFCFGKNVQLNFGTLISTETSDWTNVHGKSILDFNQQLRSQLEQLVVEIPGNNRAAVEAVFRVPQPLHKKILLALPAALGWLLHAPLYIPVRQFARHGIREEGHFDSVMTGVLLLSYPFYLLLAAFLVFLFTGGWWWLLVFIVLPFLAWSYVQLKHQF